MQPIAQHDLDFGLMHTDAALSLAQTHGHLFPGTTSYWRYRTFRRLLSERGAIEHQNHA